MSKIHRPKKGLIRLNANFRDSVIALERTLQIEGVHMSRFETWRSSERQDHMFRTRKSKAKAGQSPHNYGLAIDCTLNTDLVDVRKREWRGQMYPDGWDTVSPDAVETWKRFGVIVRRLGLEWGGGPALGGDWTSFGPKGDFPHVQAPHWRKWLVG